MPMLDPGAKAPLFTLQDQDGNKVALRDLAGSPVLLYFYPKDDTPGCTTQACGIRDQWSAFTDRGVVVLGISPDSVDSHAAFQEKYGLPHTLLSDPNATVMAKYGAWGEKNMYGKKTVGVIRSSVLVDGNGRVVKHWKRVQAAKHADQALKAIDELLD
jgi:thioredoxin-dependent peroxiredoxin